MSIRLGVNIDHIATIRNVRGEKHPSPLKVAKYVYKSGADSITIHLREDRRHINDKDVKKITKLKKIPINLEIAITVEMLKNVKKYKPRFVCLVPEKRREITTEGGLNLNKKTFNISNAINFLKVNKIRASLFLDPSIKSTKIVKKLNPDCVEIHTGKISNLVKKNKSYISEYKRIQKFSKIINSFGIEVHAGHGLDYKTTKILSKISEIKEFNIGHFIIGESIMFGLKKTIQNFKKILK